MKSTMCFIRKDSVHMTRDSRTKSERNRKTYEFKPERNYDKFLVSLNIVDMGDKRLLNGGYTHHVQKKRVVHTRYVNMKPEFLYTEYTFIV